MRWRGGEYQNYVEVRAVGGGVAAVRQIYDGQQQRVHLVWYCLRRPAEPACGAGVGAAGRVGDEARPGLSQSASLGPYRLGGVSKSSMKIWGIRESGKYKREA